ncbi:hypothetical protein HY491_02005 [Candidatus Woesearchaeota archaeon]|nr:hypothetical protein [Candidatus Woesearchaeota archaeon]
MYNLIVSIDFSPMLEFARTETKRASLLTIAPNLLHTLADAVEGARRNGFYSGFTVTHNGYLLPHQSNPSLWTLAGKVTVTHLDDLYALQERRMGIVDSLYPFGTTTYYQPLTRINVGNRFFDIYKEGKRLRLNPQDIGFP